MTSSRWHGWILLLALFLGLGGATALARNDGAALSDLFDKFDHQRHTKALKREGLACPACHQVGGHVDGQLTDEALDQVFLTPPPGACHYCHNPPADLRPSGPSRCETCHETVEPPTGHGAGWIELHGADARLGAQTCRDCHRSEYCVECHQRKESVTFQVHDRAWLSVHGIAARTEPASCGSCHLQADCVACHSTADGRFP